MQELGRDRLQQRDEVEKGKKAEQPNGRGQRHGFACKGKLGQRVSVMCCRALGEGLI